MIMNYTDAHLPAIRIKCAEIVGRNCRYFCHSCKTQVNPDTVTSGGYHSSGTCFGKVEDGVLPFTESADAALELVAWMAKPENGGFKTTMRHNEKWWAGFHKGDQSWIGDNNYHCATTLPLAICLAFLRANGLNPETL